MRRLLVSDESLNSYNIRVLTKGGRLERFEKNPIMLFNHLRAVDGKTDSILPIGTWKDLAVEDTEISAEPVFDLKDDYAAKIAGKFKRKVIKAASIGIKVLKVVRDGEDAAGRPIYLITDWVLMEISLVDIPSNENAVVIYGEDEEPIELAAAVAQFAAQTKTSTKFSMKKDFDPTTVGLAADATAADITAKFNAVTGENATLKAKVSELEEKEITRLKADDEALVDAAIADRRISKGDRTHYLSLMSLDREATSAIIKNLQPAVKLSSVPNTGGGKGTGDGKFNGMTYLELAEKDEATLKRLKEEEPEVYQELYDHEFRNEKAANQD